MLISNYLTVLITTVGERHKYLKRLFTHYQGLNCRKIVIDSSDFPYSEIDNFPEIEYYQEPRMELYEKYLKGLQLVNTEFILVAADDDFAVIKGVEQALDFLISNPDYSFANGQQLRFYEDNPRTVNSYGVWQYNKQLKDNFYSNDPVKRVNYMFETFMPPNYSVMKTNVLLNAVQLVLENPHLKPVKYFDKILGFVAAVEGNFKMLPILLLLRSNGERLMRTSANSFSEPEVSFDSIIERLVNNYDPLSEKLAKASEISMEQAQSVTLEALQRWIQISPVGKKRTLLEKISKKVRQKLSSSLAESKEYKDEVEKILNLVRTHN